MKDSEFIELLNLYLDHEITPSDAARLEADVQSNAARRRVYQEYCRIQRGCKMLAEDFATQALPESDKRIVAFEHGQGAARRFRRPLFLTGVSAAVAACVAVVFVTRSGDQSDRAGSTQTVVQDSAPSPKVQPTQFVAETVHRAEVAGQPSRSTFSLRSERPGLTLELASSASNDPHFQWMQDVRLAPVRVESPTSAQLRLQITPAIRTESQTYSSDQPLPPDRWVAIRFQK